jgi:hypothetical protein
METQMKLRTISKECNDRHYSRRERYRRRRSQVFRFSLKVYDLLDAGVINHRVLENFKLVLRRIIRAEKDYDGYIYYPLNTFVSVKDLAGQIYYCSDRWCAGRAASVIAAIDKCLRGELI